jgi:large subunit ribosomal protein L17
MFRNMVTSLLKYDRIQTTGTKAKELRRWADHVITLAKRGDLHARRQALAIVMEKDVVHKLFETAAERFGAISGGYTRIVKLGRRPGDAAPISVIELVAPAPKAGKKKKTKKKKTKAEAALPKTATEEKTEKAADKKPKKAAEEKDAAAEKKPAPKVKAQKAGEDKDEPKAAAEAVPDKPAEAAKEAEAEKAAKVPAEKEAAAEQGDAAESAEKKPADD